jgi:hypothetical protein
MVRIEVRVVVVVVVVVGGGDKIFEVQNHAVLLHSPVKSPSLYPNTFLNWQSRTFVAHIALLGVTKFRPRTKQQAKLYFCKDIF